ncbi:MAG: type II toxin-antitoxin system RatA family toxin, partial [Pseudomonadota bacterium]
DFIKWIRAIRVSDEQTEPERWRARADAAIMFKGISERFVTNVDARRDQMSVDVDLVRGPFRRLKNAWRFAPSESGGSRVEFFIDYEFSNPLLRLVMAANADRASEIVADLFVEEAKRRYGSGAGAGSEDG